MARYNRVNVNLQFDKLELAVRNSKTISTKTIIKYKC